MAENPQKTEQSSRQTMYVDPLGESGCKTLKVEEL
jgi:hypothetical protein